MGPRGKEPTFRSNLTIVYTPQSGIVWEMATGSAPFSAHEWTARLEGVKTGAWQLVQVYLKQSETSGRFVCMVDNRLIADYKGRTALADNEVSRWKLATLYTDTEKLPARGFAWQYVDDIKLWADAEALRGKL